MSTEKKILLCFPRSKTLFHYSIRHCYWSAEQSECLTLFSYSYPWNVIKYAWLLMCSVMTWAEKIISINLKWLKFILLLSATHHGRIYNASEVSITSFNKCVLTSLCFNGTVKVHVHPRAVFPSHRNLIDPDSLWMKLSSANLALQGASAPSADTQPGQSPCPAMPRGAQTLH